MGEFNLELGEASKTRYTLRHIYTHINKEKRGKTTEVKNCSFVESFVKGGCLL